MNLCIFVYSWSSSLPLGCDKHYRLVHYGQHEWSRSVYIWCCVMQICTMLIRKTSVNMSDVVTIFIMNTCKHVTMRCTTCGLSRKITRDQSLGQAYTSRGKLKIDHSANHMWWVDLSANWAFNVLTVNFIFKLKFHTNINGHVNCNMHLFMPVTGIFIPSYFISVCMSTRL